MTEHSPNKEFHDSSFLQGHNAAYVDQLYAAYVADPSSVDRSWADYFKELDEGEAAVRAALRVCAAKSAGSRRASRLALGRRFALGGPLPLSRWLPLGRGAFLGLHGRQALGLL